MVEVNRTSDRLMSIKIHSGEVVLQVISCYAPQTNCTYEEKDKFWEQLDAVIQSIGPEEHLVIGGDLNGHVGSTRNGFHQYHGGQGYGTRNDDGQRILECAEAHNLAIVNTFFRKNAPHLITYSSGGRSTQIDYILVRRQDLKLTINAKVIPSESIGAQHRLLVSDMRLDLGQHCKLRTTLGSRIKWWHLPE
ncbi:craniofacial development protein 2-like, partial [Astyanax mexicanus]